MKIAPLNIKAWKILCVCSFLNTFFFIGACSPSTPIDVPINRPSVSAPFTPSLTSTITAQNPDAGTLLVTQNPGDISRLTISPQPPASETPLPPSLTPTTIPLAFFFPVQPASVADYSQGHSGYPATDIFAPEGASFVATTSGVVDFVSYEDVWDPDEDDPATRGGLSVAIIGDDGVRYYGSHLIAVVQVLKPGMRVSAGQFLGFVGSSGNARGVDPHVHYGISHPTFPTDWKMRRGEIDPFPYLQAWENGQTQSPELP